MSLKRDFVLKMLNSVQMKNWVIFEEYKMSSFYRIWCKSVRIYTFVIYIWMVFKKKRKKKLWLSLSYCVYFVPKLLCLKKVKIVLYFDSCILFVNDVQEPTLSLGVCGSFPHVCYVHASTDALSTVVSCTTVWGSHLCLITRTNSWLRLVVNYWLFQNYIVTSSPMLMMSLMFLWT